MLDTRYITIHRLSGVIGLPNRDEVELLPADNDGVRAFLTLDKEKQYLHLRRLGALGILLAQIFVPPSNSTTQTTPNEQINNALARVSIKESARDEVFLIVEVPGRITHYELDHLIDYGEFGARIEIFDAEPQAVAAGKALRAAFAGLSLALPDNITDTLLFVGAIAYAVEPETGRPLYSTSMQASASMTVQRHLDANSSLDATIMAQTLKNSEYLDNVARLLSLSSTQNSDKLLSFLSAWTGLELFVQNVFKNTYQPQMQKLFQSAAPSSAAPFVERMLNVMRDKYNIRDKFVAVVSALNNDEAKEDIEIFVRLKAVRDDLAHSLKGDIANLPSDATRRLLRKYLKLHLKLIRE